MTLDYLDHYASLENPGYAVLVTGGWGVGKTFQVKRKLDHRNPIYVSLYGEPTVDTVHEALLVASAPATSKKLSIVGQIRTAADDLGGLYGAAAKSATSLVVRQMRRQIDNKRIIIFDDLERSSIHPQDVLGMINYYIEHHGFRVVVITHADELPFEIKSAREKIFGQAILVKPEIERCFDAIVGSLGSDHLSGLRETLINVFRLSGVESLRVARQMVHDVVRLLGILTAKQLEKKDALDCVVRNFAIWAVELHSGRINRHLVYKFNEPAMLWRLRERGRREGREVPEDEEADLKNLEALSHRYIEFGPELSDGPFDPCTLVAMLCDGEFDEELVRQQLNTSSLYIKPSDLDPWRVLYHWRGYNDIELNDALARLHVLMQEKSEKDPGILLHIFAQMLWAAYNNLYEFSLVEAQSKCIKYINDIEADLPDIARQYGGATDYENIGYPDKRSPFWEQFSHVREHLVNAGNKSYYARLNGRAQKAMILLDCGIQEFRLNLLMESQNSFDGETQPFMHLSDPTIFVDHWLGMAPGSQFDVIYVLKHRLTRVRDHENKELKWLSRLSEELEKRCVGASPLKLMRFRDLQETLKPSIESG